MRLYSIRIWFNFLINIDYRWQLMQQTSYLAELLISLSLKANLHLTLLKNEKGQILFANKNWPTNNVNINRCRIFVLVIVFSFGWSTMYEKIIFYLLYFSAARLLLPLVWESSLWWEFLTKSFWKFFNQIFLKIF